VLAEDLLPALRGGRAITDVRVHRLLTLLAGLTALGIALVVDDVLSALTCAYNLLVGGMLAPLLGAIYWRRATTAGAISSMLLGCFTAIAFMVKDGLAANTPIYAALAASSISFIGISLLGPAIAAPRRDAAAAQAEGD
jgi:SSS family solute:Na+ symporter